MSTTSSAAAARGSWCRGPFQEPWSVRPLAGPQAGRQMDSLALGHRQRDAKRPGEGRQASAGLRMQDPARIAVGATRRIQRALAERVELVRQSTPLLRSFQPPRLSLMLLLALLSVTAAAVALPQAHRATRDVLSRPSALAENFVVFGDSCVRNPLTAAGLTLRWQILGQLQHLAPQQRFAHTHGQISVPSLPSCADRTRRWWAGLAR